MPSFARLPLLGLVLGLSACAVHTPAPQPHTTLPPLQTVPATPRVNPVPATPTAPSPMTPAPRTSASFAPPPGGASHWDQRLGVYALDAVPNVYYRQRTYYRWNAGWTWATSLDGPWEATDSSGVPPGLGRLHP
jgi:hypothetical protein